MRRNFIFGKVGRSKQTWATFYLSRCGSGPVITENTLDGEDAFQASKKLTTPGLLNAIVSKTKAPISGVTKKDGTIKIHMKLADIESWRRNHIK